MLSVVRWQKTPPRRSTPLFLVGYVISQPRGYCAHTLVIPGLLGRRRREKGATQAAPHQEGRGRRPDLARGLQEGARHHLREARQEGGQVPRQRPAVPIHEQSAVRAQHGGPGRYGVEHPSGLPACDAAEGRHEGTCDMCCLGVEHAADLPLQQMGQLITPLEKQHS